jgi:signal transduction histidine kinase
VNIPKSRAARAALGFALLSTVTAAAVVTSSVLTVREADRREQMLVRYGDDLVHAAEIHVAAERMVAASRGYLLTGETALLERARRAEERLDLAAQAMNRTQARPADEARLRRVRVSAARYRGVLDDILATTASEDRVALAKTIRERMQPARQELEEAIQDLVAHEQALEAEARAEAAAIRARIVRIAITLGAIALGLSLGLGSLFTRWLADMHRREQDSSRRATEALRAKEELLGIVAHDLRSPLNAIALRAASIGSRAVSSTVRASVESIEATCQRMGHLLTSLLDAASVDAGRLSVRKDACRVSELFADLLDTFGPVASAAMIRVDHQILPRELVVCADRGRLLQVLSNLVGNAIKFTGEGGLIALSAAVAGDVVRFRVRDTGPGIPPEDLERIFERYWKAGGNREGAGLGLYIARGIVVAHGGRIWAETDPEHGATFQFEIPSERAAQSDAPSGSVVAPSPSGTARPLNQQTHV